LPAAFDPQSRSGRPGWTVFLSESSSAKRHRLTRSTGDWRPMNASLCWALVCVNQIASGVVPRVPTPPAEYAAIGDLDACSCGQPDWTLVFRIGSLPLAIARPPDSRNAYVGEPKFWLAGLHLPCSRISPLPFTPLAPMAVVPQWGQSSRSPGAMTDLRVMSPGFFSAMVPMCTTTRGSSRPSVSTTVVTAGFPVSKRTKLVLYRSLIATCQ
jgi:hypothetical protein